MTAPRKAGHVRHWSIPLLVAFSLLAGGPLTGKADAGGRRSSRPNVIIVLTDDQGYGDVGVHGNQQIRTPNLDRFAADGIELTRFYCSPVCAPTRASLMTGRYYYRTGVIHTSRGGAKMHGGETTIAELLQNAGYATAIFGKWHLGDNYPMRPQDQGFLTSLVHKSGGIGQTPDRPNSYFDPVLWRDGHRVRTKGYCTDVFFDAALRFIETHRDQPLLVYLPTNAPHAPLEVSPKYSEPYRRMGLDETMARVYGMIMNIDENFARLLNKLDELNLRRNTLVVFLADNGPQQARYNAGLRGRKASTYEGGIRVPCFLQWPARLPGRRKIDRIAAHIDLLPTLLEATGVGRPAHLRLDGLSLLPLLDGSARDWPDRALFFQCHRGLEPKRYQNCAVVTQRYKLVGFPGTFRQEHLQTSGKPALELYDLSVDPAEANNLADQEPETLARLRRQYEAWYDSVKAERHFTPGLIVIDSTVEKPVHLCRYQDGNYRDGASHGWTVRLAHAGTYQIAINRGTSTGPATLYIRWLGKTAAKPLRGHENGARFRLPAGQGVLDIWTEQPGRPRVYIRNNTTVGDVQLKQIESAAHHSEQFEPP